MENQQEKPGLLTFKVCINSISIIYYENISTFQSYFGSKDVYNYVQESARL